MLKVVKFKKDCADGRPADIPRNRFGGRFWAASGEKIEKE